MKTLIAGNVKHNYNRHFLLTPTGPFEPEQIGEFEPAEPDAHSTSRCAAEHNVHACTFVATNCRRCYAPSLVPRETLDRTVMVTITSIGSERELLDAVVSLLGPL